MNRTTILGALAGLAIMTAGIAGAATSSTTAGPPPGPGAPGGSPPGMMGPGMGPGMMGHEWGPGRFGMMGRRGPGRFGGFAGGGMDDCMHPDHKVGEQKDQVGPKRADLQACLTKTFNEMDANHDGKVSFSELKAYREAQRLKREEAAFKRFNGGQDSISKDQIVNKPLAQFDAIDTNHDGVISPDEMKAFHEAQRAKWQQQRGQNGPAN